MKKISLVILFMIALMILTSCADSKKLKEEISLNNKSPITFQGNYISSDESILTITQNSEKYDIKIEIFRLTSIEDGIGEMSVLNDEIIFTATDAAGSPIYGKIYWEESNVIAVEFTKSTWEYLPKGTILRFSRADSETIEEKAEKVSFDWYSNKFFKDSETDAFLYVIKNENNDLCFRINHRIRAVIPENNYEIGEDDSGEYFLYKFESEGIIICFCYYPNRDSVVVYDESALYSSGVYDFWKETKPISDNLSGDE